MNNYVMSPQREAPKFGVPLAPPCRATGPQAALAPRVFAGAPQALQQLAKVHLAGGASNASEASKARQAAEEAPGGPGKLRAARRTTSHAIG